MSSAENPVIASLRAQYKLAHDTLEGTVHSLTAEQAHWSPSGRAMPIAAHYAHIVSGEDFFVNGVFKGGAPIAQTTMAGKTGISEPPMPGDWTAWARRVRIEMPALRAYAQAVFAATDAYLATLTPEGLGRTIDLSMVGLGEQTIGYVVNASLLNVAWHTGEIACLKGLQGEQGYPF